MMPQKPLHLERWGKGKSLILVMLAHNVVLSVETCYEACLYARSLDLGRGQSAMPSIQEWYALYRDRNRVMRVVCEKALSNDPEGEYLVRLSQGVTAAQELGKMSERRRRETLAKIGGAKGWNKAADEERGRFERFWKEHMAKVHDCIEGKQPRGAGDPKFATPEMLFFMRVWLPSWMEYETTPARLLFEARHGDLRAMENILRLDKLAIEDTRIRENYQKELKGGNEVRVARLNDAIAGRPLSKMTLGKIKVVFGALLYKLSRELDAGLKQVKKEARKAHVKVHFAKAKLTASEVRGLFDALAKDRHLGLYDKDLPENDHALRVAFNRDKHFWPSFS